MLTYILIMSFVAHPTTRTARRDMSQGTFSNRHVLKRQWKRAARRWARPYPTARLGLMLVAVLSLAIAIPYLLPWPSMSRGQSAGKAQFQSLLYVNDPNGHLLSTAELSTDDVQRTSTQDTNSSPATKACLAMIMKNEGPILPRLFESIQGFVSEYCIVDTGSTDDTIDVLKSIDVSGVLVEEPFVDFATTRNFLLDMCRARTTCDYLVLLDADMVLKVSPEWDWAELDGKDVYKMFQVSSVEYENVRIIKRTADRIKVVGATHEYYDVPSEYSAGLLPKHLVYIDDVGDGKAKGNKFERDERLLLRELEKEPDNVRTIFYLANTLKDQGKYREAIPFYKKRVAMGGWFAEADYSLYMLSACYLALDDVDDARAYAERAAFNVAAPRAEPLYFLALYFHRQDRYELAWHYATLAGTILKPHVSQALFIFNDIYDYWVAYEQASLCCLVLPAESQLCKEMMRRFLDHVHAPDHLREYIKTELQAIQ